MVTSEPACAAWTRLATKATTLVRWTSCQSFLGNRLRSLEVSWTATAIHAATTPQATAPVRQSDAPGTTRSATPKSVKPSSSRAPMWAPRAASVIVPRNGWRSASHFGTPLARTSLADMRSPTATAAPDENSVTTPAARERYHQM
ncbi:MAG: hypothetical protein R2716_04815 [Microthrixaceae bacterium]